MHAVPCDHGLIEPQTRFGAIPIDELSGGMLITTSRALRTQTTCHRRFGLVQIYKTPGCWIPLFTVAEFLHKQLRSGDASSAMNNRPKHRRTDGYAPRENPGYPSI